MADRHNRDGLDGTERSSIGGAQPLAEAEVNKLIAAAIVETGAASIKDMGKVVAGLKPKLQGRADMAKVSAKVKEMLAGKG